MDKMYGTYDKQKINNPPISEIKSVIKFVTGNFNTRNVNKNANRNYGGYLNKSYELESFLNSTFNINSDTNSVISCIINKELVDIISVLPRLIHNSFNTFNLSLDLDDKYDGDKWIVVSIYTSIDGKLACDFLEELEEKLYSLYGEKYLNNILLSVEFE